MLLPREEVDAIASNMVNRVHKNVGFDSILIDKVRQNNKDTMDVSLQAALLMMKINRNCTCQKKQVPFSRMAYYYSV